jgi:membrane associated rhomboid family serine protease
MSIFDEIKQSYKSGSTLNKLIYINVGVFLLLHLTVIILVLANRIDRMESINKILFYLAVPSDLTELSRRPWTVLTYMFTHGFLYHILFNLLVLFWFGRYFLEEFGEKKILGLYLIGGFAGAFLYLFFYNVFPFFEDVREQSIATGASASVMAIVIAVATRVPQRRMNIVFIGPVKIIYLALFLFIVSTILDFTDNTGGKIAHMGGALAGYTFAFYYGRGKDITRSFDRFMDWIASIFKPSKSRMKVTYKRPPRDDMEYNKQKADEQKEIDRILDKISKAGYDSLTKKEKEMLFNLKK